MRNLKDTLKDRLHGAKRIALLSIGSDLRGDDAAGMLAADEFNKRLKRIKRGLSVKTTVFFGATAPENLTGEIKRLKPTHLIIVDTIDLKRRPGEVTIFKPEDIMGGVSFSTHAMPVRVMTDYLLGSFKCEITLIGIQPRSLKFGGAVSREVKDSAKEIAAAIFHNAL